MKRWKLLAGLSGAALIGIGIAVAQNTIPSVTAYFAFNNADVVPVSVNGVGSAQTQFAYAGGVGAQDHYWPISPSTGFSQTIPNNTTLVFIAPSGTLATGNLTMPALPADGGRLCIYDDQTQTAFGLAPNTNQVILGTAVTALTARTLYCWKWIAYLTPSATTGAWYRWVD